LVISPFARPSITANDSSVDHWRFTVSYNPLHVIYTTVLPNVVLVVEVIDASDTVAAEIAPSTPIHRNLGRPQNSIWFPPTIHGS
jgi:hypothetical protein